MRIKTSPFIVSFFLICYTSLAVYGQHELTLYNFSAIPQRIFENPAFIPSQKLYVGIPVLSGQRASIDNPFSYHRIFTKTEDDSLDFKAETLIRCFSKNPRIRVDEDVDILSVGTHIAKDKFFLNFGIRQRLTGETFIPSELLSLAWYGNGASQFLGQSVNISPSVNATAFDEWSVTFSGKTAKNNLTYGASIKYLSGRVNISSKKTKMNFYTDPLSYDLYLNSDFEINTSGINNIDKYFNQSVATLMFPGNNGIGLDLGATYKINDNICLNASVLDLGFIHWKSNTMKLVSHNPGNGVKYTGMTLHDFMEVFNDAASFGNKILDSITKLVDIDSTFGQSYTTFLPVRFNIGGAYTLDEHNCFSALFNGIYSNRHFSPAFGLSYTYILNKILGLTASYNIFNRQYWNFGAGVNLKAGPFQLFIVSDDVPGLILWKSTNNASIYMGINIAFY